MEQLENIIKSINKKELEKNFAKSIRNILEENSYNLKELYNILSYIGYNHRKYINIKLIDKDYFNNLLKNCPDEYIVYISKLKMEYSWVIKYKRDKKVIENRILKFIEDNFGKHERLNIIFKIYNNREFFSRKIKDVIIKKILDDNIDISFKNSFIDKILEKKYNIKDKYVELLYYFIKKYNRDDIKYRLFYKIFNDNFYKLKLNYSANIEIYKNISAKLKKIDYDFYKDFLNYNFINYINRPFTDIEFGYNLDSLKTFLSVFISYDIKNDKTLFTKSNRLLLDILLANVYNIKIDFSNVDFIENRREKNYSDKDEFNSMKFLYNKVDKLNSFNEYLAYIDLIDKVSNNIYLTKKIDKNLMVKIDKNGDDFNFVFISV